MLRITSNATAFSASLSDAAQRQLPFAVAMAINDTAAEVKSNAERRLRRDLNNPTPFTQRGLFQKRASKFKLEGVVGFKRIQKQYLKLQEAGGVRRAKNRAVVVPVGVRLNKYGNMTRTAIRRLRARKDVFSGSPGRGGRGGENAGLYQRMKTGRLKLLVAYEPTVKYKKKMSFEQSAKITAERRLPKNLTRRLLMAWNTRK